MKVGVMQPYLFPYLGYFQLVRCVDAFVLYDDVTFIKGGYINRNHILGSQGKQRFTIPVPGGSSNVLIKDLKFSGDVDKVLRTVRQAYAHAPFLATVFPIVEAVLKQSDRSIPSVCQRAIESVLGYIGVGCRVLRSSSLAYDRALPAAGKLWSISRELGSTHYVNSIGGTSLYSKADFREHGIELSFLKSAAPPYDQHRPEFVPNLSIIDVLMWCEPARILESLDAYELV